MNDILLSIEYIAKAPHFWGSMGFTTAIAMFIGALIYDGNLNEIGKGLISTLSYALIIIMVNTFRVSATLSASTADDIKIFQAYAGTVTIVLVSLFWILGMILGVIIFKRLKLKGVTHG